MSIVAIYDLLTHTSARGTLPSVPQSVAFASDVSSDVIMAISESIIVLKEGGTVESLEGQYLQQTANCKGGVTLSSLSLGVTDLAGLWIFLASCTAMGTLINTIMWIKSNLVFGKAVEDAAGGGSSMGRSSDSSGSLKTSGSSLSRMMSRSMMSFAKKSFR